MWFAKHMLRAEVDFRIQMFEDIELRKTARAPMSLEKNTGTTIVYPANPK